MTAVLILAAGASTRMGTPKQLLPYENTSLLGHVTDAALGADCGPVCIVLGANATAVRSSLGARRVQVVINAEWELGQGSSICRGVATLQEAYPGLDSVLILLGDQPMIDGGLIREFVRTARRFPGRIVAASYAGTFGVPAVFPAGRFGDLMALDPAKGAKPLLERVGADIELIGLRSNPDIDTKEDYDALIGGRG